MNKMKRDYIRSFFRRKVSIQYKKDHDIAFADFYYKSVKYVIFPYISLNL